MDYLSAISNRQQSQDDNEYWSNLAAGNLSSGLGNTFGDIQSNLAQSGIDYSSTMSSAGTELSEKIGAATQKSTQAAIERGELATQLMEAGGGILAAKDIAKKMPAAYQKAKSSVTKFREQRAKSAADSKVKSSAESDERLATQEPTEQGADYSRSATESTENPLRHPLTTEEEPVARVGGGETEMANLSAEVRTGEATGYAATDVRRPAAIGEEDSGAEIARQQSSRGVGAETEMSGMGANAETSTTTTASYDQGGGRLGSREVPEQTLADRAGSSGQGIEDAESAARTAGQNAFDSAGGTGEIGSAAQLPGSTGGVGSAAEGITGAAEEVGTSVAKSAGSEAAEGVGAAVGEAAAESGTAALTEMAVGGFNVVSDVVGAGMLLAGVGDALYNAFKGNEKAEHHEARKEDKAKDAYNTSATTAAAKQQDATTAANTAQSKAISDYHSTMSNMAGSSHLAVTGGTEQVRNNSNAQSGTF